MNNDDNNTIYIIIQYVYIYIKYLRLRGSSRPPLRENLVMGDNIEKYL